MESLDCLAVFSPVLRSGSPIVKNLSCCKKPNSYLVSTGNQCLYLFEEGQLVSTFRFPADVLCAEHSAQDQCVIIVTRDGKVWFLSLARETRQVKEDKYQRDDKNQEIFSELLGTDESNDTLAGRHTDSCQVMNVCSGSSCDVVDVALLQDAVLYEPGIETVLPMSSHFVTCGVNDIGCYISIHTKHSLDCDGGSSRQPRLTIATVCRTSVPIPMAESLPSTPFLICVQPSGSLPKSVSPHTLDRTIFEQLYGKELSLVDSSVLMLGTSDGQVYFFPLSGSMGSQYVSVGERSRQSVLLQKTKTDSQTNSCGYSLVPSLLYCLQQPISAIHVTTIPIAASTGDQRNVGDQKVMTFNSLLFVGKRDKVVVAFTNKSNPDCKGALFTECLIPGPVLCSSMKATSNVLIHSTGKEIFFSKVEFTDSQPSIQKHNDQATVTVFQCIKVPCVCSMDTVASTTQPTMDSIAVLTLKGKLLMLKAASVLNSSSFSLMKISPQVAGKTIKCLLSDIEQASEQLSQLKSSINVEDRILRDLNSATTLACKLLEKHLLLPKDHTPEKSLIFIHDIQCLVIPTVKEAGSLDSPFVSLTCKVVNHSTVAFENGWSLLVQVSIAKPEAKSTSGHSTISKSVPLWGFTRGNHVELKIPIRPCDTLHPVMVKLNLHLDLNSVLSALGRTVSSNGVVIPLDIKSLDLIDFLRPVSGDAAGGLPSGPYQGHKQEISQHSKLLATLKNINCSVGSSNFGSGLAADVNSERANHALPSCQSTLWLSRDCAHYILQCVQGDRQTYGTREGVTPEEAIILYLTATNKTFMQAISSQCSVMAQTPTGKYIELSVSPGKVPSTDNSIGGGTTRASCAFQLVLKAATVHLMCSLHTAVLTSLTLGYHSGTTRWGGWAGT